jgi:molybdopterin converting factor small subunit
MKQVEVKWFAAYREATGAASEHVKTAAGTAAELFEEMLALHQGLKGFSGAMVAINDEMAEWKSPLADGDQVLFFPPVAGG